MILVLKILDIGTVSIYYPFIYLNEMQIRPQSIASVLP